MLERELAAALDSERRADCMARIQSDAVQLALDLAVRETDIDGFFRAFIKTLVEDCESRACGVWLLDDDGARCEPWMAYADGEFHAARRRGLGRDRAAARGHGRAPRGATPTAGSRRSNTWPDDARLPESVRAFNAANGIVSVQVAPLTLPTHNLGWIALASADASACETDVAPRGARRHGPAGDAGAAPEPAGRAEPASRRGARRRSRSATASRATSTTR